MKVVNKGETDFHKQLQIKFTNSQCACNEPINISQLDDTLLIIYLSFRGEH